MARRQADHDHRKDRFQSSLIKTNATLPTYQRILAVFPNPANWLANGPSEVAPCHRVDAWEMLPQYLRTSFKDADIACGVSFCVKEPTG
jgi:hypothetical protein